MKTLANDPVRYLSLNTGGYYVDLLTAAKNQKLIHALQTDKTKKPILFCLLANMWVGSVQDMNVHPMIELVKKGIDVMVASCYGPMMGIRTHYDRTMAALYIWKPEQVLTMLYQQGLLAINHGDFEKEYQAKLLVEYNKQWNNFLLPKAKL